ncbi:uncharacterized protein EV422DRAFT_352495 [Fimicolochytrium jonesii]|uniref:uncharacterized protein n=1 Tax=Fimicolochytrium jonesii TaxID=1396493 RepID=UPI0022FED5FE|nr:uncharacterized protein EV422DRAFT_352495 [Fimicolochytrium jonesii]KAI8823367.1 hypothetical protein EV422DRAFT_352495 [Fimicolochytrium jonesii]
MVRVSWSAVVRPRRRERRLPSIFGGVDVGKGRREGRESWHAEERVGALSLHLCSSSTFVQRTLSGHWERAPCANYQGEVFGGGLFLFDISRSVRNVGHVGLFSGCRRDRRVGHFSHTDEDKADFVSVTLLKTLVGNHNVSSWVFVGSYLSKVSTINYQGMFAGANDAMFMPCEINGLEWSPSAPKEISTEGRVAVFEDPEVQESIALLTQQRESILDAFTTVSDAIACREPQAMAYYHGSWKLSTLIRNKTKAKFLEEVQQHLSEERKQLFRQAFESTEKAPRACFCSCQSMLPGFKCKNQSMHYLKLPR